MGSQQKVKPIYELMSRYVHEKLDQKHIKLTFRISQLKIFGVSDNSDREKPKYKQRHSPFKKNKIKNKQRHSKKSLQPHFYTHTHINSHILHLQCLRAHR